MPKTIKKKKEKKVQHKDDSLTEVREELRDKFGKESITQYEEAEPVPTISTGIIALDKAMGGGFPEGRMVEISGENSSGKTTIALSAAAQAQKKYPDLSCVYVDAEHVLDTMWAVKLGINLKKFEHADPEYGEDAIFMMEAYLKSGNCSVIILDSVAALLPQVEVKGEIGEANIGLQARLISTAMRRLNRLLNKNPHSILIFINQKRAQIAGGPSSFRYEASKNTGGRSLPFYMTTRLPVRITEVIRKPPDGGPKVGQVVLVDVFKHKVNNGPGQKALFRISNEYGIDTAHELLDWAIETDKIKKSSSWYAISETGEKVQGEDKMKAIIREKYFEPWKELALNGIPN